MTRYTQTLVVGRGSVDKADLSMHECTQLIGTQPVAYVRVPDSARHISRVHALVRWIPFTPAEAGGDRLGLFVLRILGQNGLIVDGRRRRAAQVVRLDPGRTELDFFGLKVQFAVDDMDSSAVAPDGRSPTKRGACMGHIPPSSPAAFAEAEEENPIRPRARDCTPSPAAELSPLRGDSESPAPARVARAWMVPESPTATMWRTQEARISSTGAEVAVARTENAAVEEEEHAMVCNDPSPCAGQPCAGTLVAAKTRPPMDMASQFTTACSLVARLAPTYDLAGLLAGAIVFHRTATISTSEAVRSVLSANPGMMRGEVGARTAAYSPSKRRLPGTSGALPEHGTVISGWESGTRWQAAARRAWHECLAAELQRARMFGDIQRPGKDTSGNPLECWYYYDQENDPDVERAQNLGAFVKPMRSAVRSQKPIFWKKSEYGRATSGHASEGADDKLPYSPRAQYAEEGTEGKPRRRRGDAGESDDAPSETLTDAERPSKKARPPAPKRAKT
ncbi:hypothetical protein MSPP1_003505 [Malassezia sp. CBS 17886]|nr:hypothetical protein MSPP1_003505 [Malassezia sp. CBS 17886]